LLPHTCRHPPTSRNWWPAVAGDRGAWDGLVLPFTPLVASVIRGYRLSDADADDVCQELWLKLVKHLKDLREPQALPGWIVTCTRHEAIRVLSARRRIELVDPHASSRIDRVDHPEVDEDLLRQESRQAVRAALGELSEEHRTLLLLLIFADSKVSYGEIGRTLGMPTGASDRPEPDA
jgi:RNA polymerase sigma factor (sigma-70 family)